MRFKLDEAFDPRVIKVRVTYLDRGKGRWTISDQKGVQNADTGLWKTVEVMLQRDEALTLNYYSGDDTVFHLIEVEREL